MWPSRAICCNLLELKAHDLNPPPSLQARHQGKDLFGAERVLLTLASGPSALPNPQSLQARQRKLSSTTCVIPSPQVNAWIVRNDVNVNLGSKWKTSTPMKQFAQN